MGSSEGRDTSAGAAVRFRVGDDVTWKSHYSSASVNEWRTHRGRVVYVFEGYDERPQSVADAKFPGCVVRFSRRDAGPGDIMVEVVVPEKRRPKGRKGGLHLHMPWLRWIESVNGIEVFAGAYALADKSGCGSCRHVSRGSASNNLVGCSLPERSADYDRDAGSNCPGFDVDA